MSQFTVYYVVRDWVEVKVAAQDEKTAKEIALKKVEESGYKDKAIDIVDGKTEFAGITLNDIIDQLN